LLKFIPVENRSRPYIVTEYLRGYTLSHLLNNVRPLPEKDALKFAVRICEALEHMHEHQVIHRDLKPQNIMVCYDGTIRIMDFGIAKAAEGRRITFTGFTPSMGTPDYMAPEQVKGKRGDERTDIYSLGAILYEMATGFTPFEGENPFVIMNARVASDPVAPTLRNPQLSPQVEEIILHAMAREPAQRYPSATALKTDLADPGQVELTGRVARLQTSQPWQSAWRRQRTVILLILIPLLAVIAAAILIALHR
jgi:serine/threonine-protein kinase